jgi:twitching motility protein PilT
MAAIDPYLNQVIERDGSDLHFLAGDPPRVRQYGELKPLSNETLSGEKVKAALYEIMPKLALERFEAKDGTDFAYSMPGVARFRVNVMRQLNGMGGVFRVIPSKARTADELKLPDAVRNLCKVNSGLVLVTGKTGSGKSTTLAAMIDDINTREKGHILTIEDPIEFVHTRKNCLISQREIGVHSPSFSSALLSALREDPDVILVGELRDAETIRMAMTAAETGHLVLGTLHTTSAVKTIDRLIDALPAEEREQTKSFLSQSLLAVVTQILVKTNEGRGRKAIVEIMIMTKAIAKLITSDQTHQIPSQLQMGREFGMQMFDQALLQALNAREIDPDDAYVYATDKRLFQKFVTDTSILPRMDSTLTTQQTGS